MDIRYLNYFVEVAKQGGFTKAAESLNLTQPTLSKMIKNLEDELGVTLFDRSGKQISLTDTGAVALRQVQRILQSVEELYSLLDDVANLKTGNIRIGLPPIIGSLFFPRIIAEFHRSYPKITIELIENGAKTIEHSLENGMIDFAVVVAPVNESVFYSHPFITEELAVIAHSKHHLSRRSSVSLIDLKAESFILLGQSFTLHDLIRKACIDAGFVPNVEYESSQWDFIAEMVAADMGISILPRTICEKIANPNVKILSLVKPTLPWELIIIWPKNRYISFATRELIDFIQHRPNEPNH